MLSSGLVAISENTRQKETGMRRALLILTALAVAVTTVDAVAGKKTWADRYKEATAQYEKWKQKKVPQKKTASAVTKKPTKETWEQQVARVKKARTTCKDTAEDDRSWLAKALYYETLRNNKGTPLEMEGIAWVVLNRADAHDRVSFGGPSLCKVVTHIAVEGSRSKVQFSFLLNPLGKPRGADWERAQTTATSVMDAHKKGVRPKNPQFATALFYRNTSVKKITPRTLAFFNGLTNLGKLKHHTYYCIPGFRGCGSAVMVAKAPVPRIRDITIARLDAKIPRPRFREDYMPTGVAKTSPPPKQPSGPIGPVASLN